MDRECQGCRAYSAAKREESGPPEIIIRTRRFGKNLDMAVETSLLLDLQRGHS
jgi:hypothetical protein